MAFNNLGPLTFLAPGQTAYWWYSFGSDHGTQFASADVKTPNQGAIHMADQQRKQKNNDGITTYYVDIHNKGVGACFHNLQGGGMS
jgi:TnpA family transposase